MVPARPMWYVSSVMHIEVTGATRAEEALVLSSWLKTYRVAMLQRGDRMPVDAFYPWARRQVMSLLNDGARVFVAREASDPGSEGFVYGWLCCDLKGNAFRLHWAYTKRAFRRQNVMATLLSHALDATGVEDERLVFTGKTRLNKVFERMGFEYEPVKRERERGAA